MSMTRRLLMTLGLTAVAFVWAARADDPLPIPPVPNKGKVAAGDEVDPETKLKDAASQQERLKQQFELFKQALVRLKQRLAASSKTEDRDKAAVLEKALAKANEQGIDAKFSTLVDSLKSSNAFADADSLQSMLDRNEDLRRDIRSLIELLLQDNRDEQLRKQREELTKLLEQLKAVISKQERVRTQVDIAQRTAEELKKEQEKVTDATRKLIDPKAVARAGDPKAGKPGEPKPGEPKPGEPKPGDPKTGKPGEPKPGEPKPGEPKPGEPKPGEPKTGKPGAPSDDNPPPSPNKPSESKPSDADGSGRAGLGKKDPPPGDKPKPPPSPPQPDGPPPEKNPVKKQIEDSQKYQGNSEEELGKKNNPKASEEETKALEKLMEAQKKLEELLRQLREEEIERLLAQLQARCERMLAMQKVVRDGTVLLDKSIEQGHPTREQEQTSNVLSDKEDEIVKDASKALALIQAEGSAVAFAEVFQQVRGDMITVGGRLRRTDAGVVTVTIENQIIETLGEMIDALKKARAENAAGKSKPSPGGTPPDPKLIDQLAELKMIRSMQVRVNTRTDLYAKEYAGKEQVPTGSEKFEAIQKEVRDLGEREKKIVKVTRDIATGKNKAN